MRLPDALWQLIAPLVARPRTTPKGGRPPKDQRAVVEAIVFVLQTGCPWKALGSTTFGVSPATAHRWHQRWSREGVWRRVHRAILGHMQKHGVIAWERGVVDSSSVRSPGGGGSETGRNPTDRGRPGSKHHVVTDARGTPLAVAVTGANVSDSTTLERMMDAVPAVRSGAPGRPRRRFHKLHADKGYDSRANRKAVQARGMVPRIARRGVESSERLGRHRWVVERTIAWEHQFRRLLVRHDRQASVHLGFLELASAIISFKQAPRAGAQF